MAGLLVEWLFILWDGSAGRAGNAKSSDGREVDMCLDDAPGTDLPREHYNSHVLAHRKCRQFSSGASPPVWGGK